MSSEENLHKEVTELKQANIKLREELQMMICAKKNIENMLVESSAEIAAAQEEPDDCKLQLQMMNEQLSILQEENEQLRNQNPFLSSRFVKEIVSTVKIIVEQTLKQELDDIKREIRTIGSRSVVQASVGSSAEHPPVYHDHPAADIQPEGQVEIGQVLNQH